VVEELDGGGTAVARYTQGLGIDEPLAMVRGGASYYYNADGLGSITSLMDASGQIAASYTYDSFGKLTASTGTVTNPFRYTGREYGTDTGLYYYRARYYDSSVGRFISEDPLGFYSDVNFYPYVENAPPVLVDPSGLYSCVQGANCDFMPEMNNALHSFENCLEHNITITCGRSGHAPSDPHMRGLAVDVGHGTNPWLNRGQVIRCFNAAFPSDAYGQQEYNRGNSGEYHYHLQYTPGRGSATGFSTYIHPQGH
jgi:RHS repeat-associated protein